MDATTVFSAIKAPKGIGTSKEDNLLIMCYTLSCKFTELENINYLTMNLLRHADIAGFYCHISVKNNGNQGRNSHTGNKEAHIHKGKSYRFCWDYVFHNLNNLKTARQLALLSSVKLER